jgi:CHAT domain-containing protein
MRAFGSDRLWRLYLFPIALCGLGITLITLAVDARRAAAMTVDEARKLAAGTNSFTPPARNIDDIAKVLEQAKPDAAKIKKLRDVADQKAPPGLSGFALAEFLAARGLAARDLGRSQQRLADLRAAYELSKPLALQRSPFSVLDLPTASKPFGNPNFRAFVEAKRERKIAARQAERQAAGPGPGFRQGGPAPGGPGARDRNPDAPAYGPRGPGRPGGPGPGGPGPLTPEMIQTHMPKSAAEARARLSERFPAANQRAVRILQQYILAEIAGGTVQRASEVYEEARPSLLTSMAGVVVSLDLNMATANLKSGNVEAARRAVTRGQQMVAPHRQYSFLSAHMNNFNSQLESAQGEIFLATGQLAEAEAKFRIAIRLGELSIKDIPNFAAEPPPPGTLEARNAHLRRLLADTLARQGKLLEAEFEIRRALLEILKLQSEGAPQTAGTVLILADVLQTQGRYRDAQRLSEIALDIYVRGGVTPAAQAEAMLRVAVGQASQGQWTAALATYEKLKQLVANDEVARRRYTDGNVDLALALVHSGQASTAIPIFESIVATRAKETANEYAVAEARGFLALAMAAAGRDEDAVKNFQAATPTLVAATDAGAREEGALDRQNRRQSIFDGYIGLLSRIQSSDLPRRLGLDPVDEAFRIADVVHSKSVHGAIAAASARAASGDSALNELIRQTQDADQKLVASSDLLKAMLEAPAADQQPSQIQALRAEIGKLREARQTLRREVERKFPAFAELTEPKPVGIQQAKARLRPGEALVVIYYGASGGVAWAVPHEGETAFSRLTLPEADAIALVGDLRKSVSSDISDLEKMPVFDVAKAHSLFAGILQPVETGWRQAKNLSIVSHGSLGQLPFAVMVTRPVAQPAETSGEPLFAGYRSVPFMARDAAITQVPSVAALMSLRALPAGARDRKPFLGFGDPLFTREQALAAAADKPALMQVAAVGNRGVRIRSASTPTPFRGAKFSDLVRLPDTGEELLEVAKALGANPEQDVLMGSRASERTARTMRLDDRKVVMFATHGLTPGEIDGLAQPALALSSPEVPGVEGDGLLTVADILSLKLDADWVVLSACNTAAGEGAGAEAVSGLGRAFFYAGARALLVTHWPVETVSARVLTTSLFRRQAADPTINRAEALRQTMVELITSGQHIDPATGKTEFTYAHPLFWAPYALVGDGSAQ